MIKFWLNDLKGAVNSQPLLRTACYIWPETVGLHVTLRQGTQEYVILKWKIFLKFPTLKQLPIVSKMYSDCPLLVGWENSEKKSDEHWFQH